MIIEISEKEYKFNTKLRTTLTISKEMGKPYTQVMKELSKLDVKDLIKLLYCGLDNREEVSLKEFTDFILDSDKIGVADIYEYVQKFIQRIQYPTLSEEEIEKKFQEAQDSLKGKNIQDIEI